LVFVIQHTQAREQMVTQRKLDEILRALPHADNALIAFEEVSDDELASTHHSHRRLRAQASIPRPSPTRPRPAGGDDPSCSATSKKGCLSGNRSMVVSMLRADRNVPPDDRRRHGADRSVGAQRAWLRTHPCA
jgi:hypothetical protein